MRLQTCKPSMWQRARLEKCVRAIDIPWYVKYASGMARGKKARMGRPPFPKGTARSLHVTVRLTARELRRLRAEARRRGVSVSELLMRPWRKGS